MKQRKEERACVISQCHQGHFSAIEMTALEVGADFGRREGSGVGVGGCLKQLNEREEGSMYTWSTVQLTDWDQCSLTFFKAQLHATFLPQICHLGTEGHAFHCVPWLIALN